MARIAIVTGGSRGIGAAISRRLQDMGVTVVANYAGNEDKAKAFEGETGIRTYKWDVGDFDACQAAFAQITEEVGPVDILVNNAGITRDGLLLRMKPEDWDQVIATNLTSVFRLSRGCLRHMTKQRHGRIVSITSIVGAIGNAGQANYAAAKAGLIGLTQSVAREFASRGITCNCVCPGFFDTDMTSVLKDDLKSKVLTTIPLNRFGKPEEVAGLVSFLCGPDAGYVTGQAWAIDGGMTM